MAYVLKVRPIKALIEQILHFIFLPKQEGNMGTNSLHGTSIDLKFFPYIFIHLRDLYNNVALFHCSGPIRIFQSQVAIVTSINYGTITETNVFNEVICPWPLIFEDAIDNILYP